MIPFFKKYAPWSTILNIFTFTRTEHSHWSRSVEILSSDWLCPDATETQDNVPKATGKYFLKSEKLDPIRSKVFPVSAQDPAEEPLDTREVWDVRHREVTWNPLFSLNESDSVSTHISAFHSSISTLLFPTDFYCWYLYDTSEVWNSGLINMVLTVKSMKLHNFYGWDGDITLEISPYFSPSSIPHSRFGSSSTTTGAATLIF